uniref:Uncharacterized protein n=2 Tax=unclassified Caudoviricetes TaxID=2788787 RepID=A0A8S5Q8L9_9CAUD|nr:MAG TPA: hypothetical protein [Siphoviridae sp. ctAvK3]DAE15139.1 MAG TPA: hypothetical protein [Siphoviridae sp. ctdVv30]
MFSGWNAEVLQWMVRVKVLFIFGFLLVFLVPVQAASLVERNPVGLIEVVACAVNSDQVSIIFTFINSEATVRNGLQVVFQPLFIANVFEFPHCSPHRKTVVSLYVKFIRKGGHGIGIFTTIQLDDIFIVTNVADDLTIFTGIVASEDTNAVIFGRRGDFGDVGIITDLHEFFHDAHRNLVHVALYPELAGFFNGVKFHINDLLNHKSVHSLVDELAARTIFDQASDAQRHFPLDPEYQL